MASRRRSQQEWSELVEEWRSSSQSRREFCSERALNPRTLSWWTWKLRQVAEDRGHLAWIEAAPMELPRSGGSTAASTDLTLILGEGISIRIPVGFDPPTLERLVRTLGVIEC